MNDRDFDRERRKQRRLGQLGTNNPWCTCGETDWRCFDVGSMPRCINCHLKSSPNPDDRSLKRKLKALGTDRPICGACGETDPRCFELHHVAGRKQDSMTVLLCANDHRRVTDDQKDHPTPTESYDELLAKIGNFLLGLADMLRVIVERLIEFGNALIEHAAINTIK